MTTTGTLRGGKARSASGLGLLPLGKLEPKICRDLIGVLCDVDDTITTDGRLGAEAYQALQDLHDAGLLVIPVTGRPAGWCDLIARFWPVAGVVGENGAFWFRKDPATGRMQRFYVQDAMTRAENRRRLTGLRQRVLAEVPGTAVAADQAYREVDLAIDFREDVAPLPDEDVARIVGLFEAAGANAKISSIHVNGWFGDHDKLDTTKALLADGYGVDLDASAERFVFVGDSPNDAPMFARFPHSVGVANVADFAGRMEAWPRYVTKSCGGAGFVELAKAVLGARAGKD